MKVISTCNFLSSIAILFATNIVHSAKYAYEFRFVSSITPAEQDDVETTSTSVAQEHVCQSSEEEKIHICEEALKDPIVEDSSIKLVENATVLPQQLFKVVVYPTIPSMSVTACMCPTNPPMYLKDEPSGNKVYVYVCQEDTYVHVIERMNKTEGGDDNSSSVS